MREFITADEVAEILEIPNAATFLRMRHRLERDEDFPPPVPMQLRPLKWRRGAVEAWKGIQGHPESASLTADRASYGPNVVLMSEAARP